MSTASTPVAEGADSYGGGTISVAINLSSNITSCQEAQGNLCSGLPDEAQTESSGESFNEFAAETQRLLEILQRFSAQISDDIEAVREAGKTLTAADADAAAYFKTN